MKDKARHIMVLRFSAMGDVALLTPIVKSFIAAYPSKSLTVVSRPKFESFFIGYENLNFFSADVDKEYSSVTGLIRLTGELKKMKPDIIVDLHDHIRSRFICFLFQLSGVKVVRFDKGRNEKKQITRKENKIRIPLPHTVERYRNAFVKAGLSFELVSGPYLNSRESSIHFVETWLMGKRLSKNEKWFGLAPFAAHTSKIWPVENYRQVIQMILEKMNAKFFLFGGGSNEVAFFQSLIEEFKEACILVAGEMRLPEEIELIKRLDKMICVDSSNMHLASLAGVKTVSIWGGTHTSTGFSPFSPDQQHKIIEVTADKLSCRPCSVYGKETCWRGDFACLNQIKPDHLFQELNT